MSHIMTNDMLCFMYMSVCICMPVHFPPIELCTGECDNDETGQLNVLSRHEHVCNCHMRLMFMYNDDYDNLC